MTIVGVIIFLAIFHFHRVISAAQGAIPVILSHFHVIHVSYFMSGREKPGWLPCNEIWTQPQPHDPEALISGVRRILSFGALLKLFRIYIIGNLNLVCYYVILVIFIYKYATERASCM